MYIYIYSAFVLSDFLAFVFVLLTLNAKMPFCTHLFFSSSECCYSLPVFQNMSTSPVPSTAPPSPPPLFFVAPSVLSRRVLIVRLYIGDAEQAEAFHRRALRAREMVHGPNHPDVPILLSNLAGTLYVQVSHGYNYYYRVED